MASKRSAQALAGLSVSALAWWAAARGISWRAAWDAARDGDYRFLVPYAALFVAIHLVRVLRWRLLLGPVNRVRFRRLNAATAVGMMAVQILPFRMGELARPTLVADGVRLPFAAALSSVVVERLVDGLSATLLLVLAALALPPELPGLPVVRAAGLAAFAAFAALTGALALAWWKRSFTVRLTERLLRPISVRLAERSSRVVDAFIEALRFAPGGARVPLLLVLTVAYWALAAASIRVLAMALGLHLSVAASALVLGTVVLGVMIPAGPAMVGTFQAGVVAGLSLALPAFELGARGVAFANVLWGAQVGLQVAMGLLFLASPHIRTGLLLRGCVAGPGPRS
ncbi:lysylphosphatidylglycerol synthase transmembrane domain-containing protein [Anaeromyxobacter diazotrophicus]|uniref:lysylphosphatidylglycerol synthase transmembrane domain-containing protein n=1 Tax=Anaeromyxobacter diazotrophicus TaxID=2590199 RepID=UPI00159085E4|nr:lysylphosphatidylglycerol synthase transmembrane domain-containing protein [Anaeromyxobacter diazotrophicus]